MTLYRSKQVLLESGLQTAGILVGRDGKIDRILTGELLNSCDELEVVDVDDLVIMAGVVDSHVHVNEPGRTDWEGYWSATRAAAAGGVTTIVDMPLNSIPSTTTVSNLQTKLKAAQGQTHVDVAFWGGVIPGNQDELRGMVAAGVVGFKCFLCPSGVDEFPHVSLSDVEKALHQLYGTSSLLAVTTSLTIRPFTMFPPQFHAECDLDLEDKEGSDDPCQYQTFLNSRPPAMEVEAIRIVTQLCLKYSVRCHIVHLSAAEALPLVHAAKQQGALLTAETCHHYLTLAAEEVPNSATQYKCCPPVRGQPNRRVKNNFGNTTHSTPHRDSNLDLPIVGSPVYCESSALDRAATKAEVRNPKAPWQIHIPPDEGVLYVVFLQELLWKALYEGELDMVVSDHSPCTPDLKKLEQGDFLSAWGGISSLQFGLSLFWTEARLRGFTFLDVTRLLSSAPAKLCGLQDRKGCLTQGMDADLVIWDPLRSFQGSSNVYMVLHEVSSNVYMVLHEVSSNVYIVLHEGSSNVYMMLHEGSSNVYIVLHGESSDVYMELHRGRSNVYMVLHGGSSDVYIVLHEGSSNVYMVLHEVTPYLGKTLYGVVMRTIVRGNTVYQHDKPFPRPRGELLISPQL
uniref:Amidohydrolase-related domain-containing protein n=1 Tax=Timema shepardi TaxID=629360 RepID=A0A7R9AX24_TIMSH|nr:unnamed protein product [Timema shepardi]